MPATTLTTSAHQGGKESIMDFTSITAGTLPAGTVTPFGVIERGSLTAYLIDGEWVAFGRVHGRPVAASPLVVFG
jgi:hypothetical protein